MRVILISLIMALGTQVLGNDDFGKRLKKIEKFAFENQFGKQDFWLQMEVMGGWDNIALIFNTWDDYEKCLQIVGALTAVQTNKPKKYRCSPANPKLELFSK